MKEGILASAVLVTYMVLGGWLTRVWGLNPSRATPYAGQTGRRRGGLLRLLGLYLLCCIWLTLLMTASLLRAANEAVTFIQLAVYGVSGGLLSMAALFVSVRHDGQDMASFAGSEYGSRAEKAMHILAVLAMLPIGAAACNMVPGILTGELDLLTAQQPAHLARWTMFALFGLHAMLPGVLLGGRVRHERQIRSVGLGSVLLGAAAAAVLAMVYLRTTLSYECAWLIAQALLCVCTAAAAMGIVWHSLDALSEKRSLYARRRRGTQLIAPAATVLCTAALSYVGYVHLMMIGGVLSFVYALWSLVMIWTWLRVIGRGLLWRR